MKKKVNFFFVCAPLYRTTTKRKVQYKSSSYLIAKHKATRKYYNYFTKHNNNLFKIDIYIVFFLYKLFFQNFKTRKV